MPVLTQLNLNVGTEQNPNMVLHDLHDKRISTTAVTTATHLLTCNSGVTSIAPITVANLASVLGGLSTSITIPGNESLEAPSGWASKILALKNSDWTTIYSIFSITDNGSGIVRLSQSSGGLSINDEQQSIQLHISTIDNKLMIRNNDSSAKHLVWRIL